MNKSDHHIEEYQLIEYLSGRGGEELMEKVDLWLQESDENLQYFEQIRKLWAASIDAEIFESIDVDTNWMAVKMKAGIRDRSDARLVNWLHPLWKIAAAVLLIAVFSYIVFQNISGTQDNVVTITAGNTPDKFDLPDGSKVWLNSDSQITYKANFNTDERKLTLDGEGFFEVAHNKEKPFKVFVNDTETTVLGTSFNIKEEAGGVSLVLVTGIVQMIKGDQKTILAPGEKVITDQHGQLIKMTNDDPNFNAWKTRKLSFSETPVNEVIKSINVFYKVQIEIENDIFGACPLTTAFENATLEEVLETLVVIFDVELTQQGKNKYILSGVGCGDS